MRAALGQAEAGRGKLLVVTGEPGIGKSALVDAFAAWAGQRGARVLWGAAWEDGGAPAYWPWVQVLRAAGLQLPQSGETARDLAPLGRLLPSLAGPETARVSGEGERFALFDAVVTALELAAAAAPLVVVIEDLQAAGVPSALLLRFAAQHIRGLPVLLVATYRDVEARLTPGLGEIVDGLEATGAVLPLPALSPQEVRDLVAPVLAEVPAGLLDKIVERTEGNPLFVTQVARLLAQSPSATQDLTAAPIPAGIRQAVRQRLDRVAGAADVAGTANDMAGTADVAGTADDPANLADPANLPREALTVSAVLGGEFDLGEVADVLDASIGELLGALGPAVRSGLLVELGPQRFRFAHALVREAIYGDLASKERATLHHRVATALAQRSSGIGDHARLAHHFSAAVPVGGAEAAVRHATAAGEEAMRALAYEEAAGLFQQAVSALHHTTGDRTAQRCELLLSLGGALVRAGDLGRALPVLVQATEHARRCGSGELLGRAALLRTKHLDFNVVEPEAIALLEEAARALDGTDTPTLARVYAQLGLALQHEPERISAATDLAVEVARRCGDRAALAAAMSARLHTRWGRHEPRAALAEADELVRLADQTGDAELATTAHMWRLTFSLELGEPAGAQTALDQVTELANRSQQPILRLLATSRAGTLATVAGRFEDALALADEALEIGLRAQLPDAEPVHFGQLLAISRSIPLPAEHQQRMERILRDQVTRSEWPVPHQAALLLVDLAHGDREPAADRLASLIGTVPELRRDGLYVWTLALLAEACTALGAAAHAEGLYAALLPYAGRFVVAGNVQCLGAAHHFLAGLAALAGRPDDAERHYQAAMEQHRRAGAAPMLARSCREYAEMLRQRGGPGDVSRAEELTAEAAGGCGSAAPEHREAATASAVLEGEFRRSGRTWQVWWDGASATVPDSKGMRDLAALLTAPEREVHVLDLVQAAGGPPAAAAGGHAGQRLDREARAAYRQRLHDLEGERAEAEANADAGRLERLRDEQEFLARELAGTLGLGGRVRAEGDPVERARKAVGMRIRTALKAITEVSPALARHLDRSVTTGRYCSYRPERPVRWRL